MNSTMANRELRRRLCSAFLTDCLRRGKSSREFLQMTLEDEADTRCEVLTRRKSRRGPCPR